jgi:HD-GYP domain-containing protein (c-di-GMP phosphodiesterase class II)
VGELLVDGALQATGSSCGFLAVKDGEKFRILFTRGLEPQEHELMETGEVQDLFAASSHGNGAIILSALSVMEKLPGLSHAMKEVPTLMLAALRNGEAEPAGVIGVGASSKDFNYSQGQALALQSLARDAAVSLSNLDAYREMKKSYYDVIFSLTKALEASSSETYQHSVRVKALVLNIAKAMGYSGEFLNNLIRASLLHDAGKIALPGRLLTKPSALSFGEQKRMREHPRMAWSVIKDLNSIEPDVASMILHHHEAWDGTGYPDGLSGESIPLGARIIAVAEAYDTMINPQPYRKAVSVPEALAEIERQSGLQFDPQIVGALVSLERESQENGKSGEQPNGS